MSATAQDRLIPSHLVSLSWFTYMHYLQEEKHLYLIKRNIKGLELIGTDSLCVLKFLKIVNALFQVCDIYELLFIFNKLAHLLGTSMTQAVVRLAPLHPPDREGPKHLSSSQRLPVPSRAEHTGLRLGMFSW